MALTTLAAKPFLFLRLSADITSSSDGLPNPVREAVAAGCDTLVILVPGSTPLPAITSSADLKRISQQMAEGNKFIKRHLIVVEGANVQAETKRVLVKTMLSLIHTQAEVFDSLTAALESCAPGQSASLSERLRAAGLLAK